jgi:glutathione S-transferase
MKIYFSPFSPYVRKCLVVAQEVGLGDRIERLAASAHPVQRDQTIIASNPLGKVPTLLTDEGVALYDSRVISEYLNDLGRGSLFPPPGAARWEALTNQSLADGILDAALLARYEVTVRPQALNWADWVNGQLDKIVTSFDALEKKAGGFDDRVDIGTISLGCALWYLDLRFADMGWRARYPKVAAWYERIGQRPSMKMTWAVS